MSTAPQLPQQSGKHLTFPTSSSNQTKPKRRGPSHPATKSKRRTTMPTSSKSKATTTMPRKRRVNRSQFKSDIAPETQNQTSSGSTMTIIPKNLNVSGAQSTSQAIFPPCINLSAPAPHFPSFSNSTSVKTISTDSSQQPLTVDAIAYVSDVFETVFSPQINGATPVLKTVRTVLIKRLLLDHAVQELLTRQIFTFEELHDFTVEILRRSALIP